MAATMRSAGKAVSVTGRCHRYRTIITPRKETAFSRKVAPAPTPATMAPPRAGPMARDRLNPALFREMAWVSSRRGTSSGTIACQAGAFMAAPRPSKKVKLNSTQGEAAPRRVRAARSPCRHHHPGLGRQQEPAPVDDVGQSPGRQRQQEHGENAGGLHQGHHRRRGGKRRHEPGGPHALHKGAHIGNQGGQPQRPEYRMLQGTPGRGGRRGRFHGMVGAVFIH